MTLVGISSAYLALLCILGAHIVVSGQIIRRSHACSSYTPTLCLISLSDAHVSREHCQDCKFHVSRTFYCPLVAAGYYSYSSGMSEAGGCPNPFLAHTTHPPPPCGQRCCRMAHAGNFTEDDPLEEESEDRMHKMGGGGLRFGAAIVDGVYSSNALQVPRLQFEPTDSTCRYKEISRGQVMSFLASHNSSFVVIGDSTMRQFYLRLIAMMRGQQRQLDFHIHTHAHYQICREVDFLRIAANNPSGSATPSDAAFLKAQIPAFFRREVGPGQADAKRVLSECSHSPLEMNYLQAPTWKAQEEVLIRYMNGLKNAATHLPVLIVSVGLWQSGDIVPAQYLKTLESMRNRAARIIYIGSPASRMVNTERKQQLATRNAIIRTWIEKQGSPFSYLDFDAMASAPNAPTGTHGSKHYGCWAEWKSARFPASANGNPAGSGQVMVKLNRIHPTLDGTCADEMNRNLWQVVLNGLLDSSGAQMLAKAQPGGLGRR